MVNYDQNILAYIILMNIYALKIRYKHLFQYIFKANHKDSEKNNHKVHFS
jgi:hypothetical protein